MKLELFSDEWAKAAADIIKQSTGYKQAAKNWEGAMIFTLQADPSLGVPEPRSAYLDLWHGDCREGRAAQKADLESAPYIVSADAYTWKQVLEGKLEPIQGLLRGKLKLQKGNMAVLARYVAAAKELVHCATLAETKYPGEE